MHELLSPSAASRDEAAARCDRYLGTRWKRWRLARLTLRQEASPHLITLAAWHRLARELAHANEHSSFERRRGLDEMIRELDAIYADSPTSTIGIALASSVQRFQLPSLAFRGPLQALAEDRHVHAYETRGELLVYVRRLAHPEGRLALRIMDVTSERDELLSDALCTGVQLSVWIANLSADWARGNLYLPVEDLTRFGVGFDQLREGRFDEPMRRLVISQVAWAREHLHKGWPLCHALGPLRGRQLAFLLRWHAASLSAIEARGFDVLRGPPPAGWLRALACATVSATTPAAPELG